MTGKRLWWMLVGCLAAGAVLAAILAVWPRNGADTIPEPSAGLPVEETPIFQEITQVRGLPSKTAAWPDGTFAVQELGPGGVAFLDYDNDGRIDILQVCHSMPGDFDEPSPIRLFHQESDGSFKSVTNAGGLQAPGYGQGVAIGDYNNDGFSDVYITTLGHNALFRNNGDGTFTDVTAAAGLLTKQKSWSTSAAWLDYDRDGHLDLVVLHFAVLDPSQVCTDAQGKREYCGPHQYEGVGATLYHNNGNGSFTDVTAKAGINYPGRGWGVVCADLTGDGWVDIYVANDNERQNLWVNQHNGTFKDEALERAVAFSGAGRTEAGMGVTVGDVANDGRLALFITHVTGEKHTLYMPAAKGEYADKSTASGVTDLGLTYTGWGCGFGDFDNDGNLDLAFVCGRVYRGPVHPRAALGPFWNGYAQNNVLLRGDGRGRFTDNTARGGDFTALIENTRGLALGDIDDDGRIDLVTNSLDNTLRLYHNVADTEGNHWLLVRALTGKRDALGARLELVGAGHRWTRLVQAACSFCSSCDPRAHFGLGRLAQVEALEVLWPDGRKERFDVPGIDRLITIHQGKGQMLRP